MQIGFHMEVMMNSQFVRIESITIENFKNVRKGVLDFENRRKKYRTSIVGLYGQNGSGKTALIDAIQLLKYSLCGKSAPNKYADYINVEKDFAILKFQFKMQKAEETYDIWYQFSIKKVLDYSDMEGDALAESETRYKIQIFDEVLSFGVSGAVNCGGKSIDDAIVEEIKTRFETKNNCTITATNLKRLRTEVEKAKVQLSEYYNESGEM